ncbi:MAG: complex I subunit 1 family protein [Desulfurococcaceae archaeon]
MYQTVLYALLSVLVFPGLIFLVSLAFFTQYLVRKLSARYQRRMGPSYVGPFGVLQPFFDFWKLLRYKELVKTRFSLVKAAEISLIIGLSFTLGAVIFLPLSPFSISSSFDVLLFFYMTSVIPLLALILASLSMPGPYTTIGVSRLLSIATIAEPAYFASIVIPVYLATRYGVDPGGFMSIGEAYTRVYELWADPRTAVVMVLCLISFIVSVQAKAMYPPFNIPEAEQEIIAGFETEFSGPLLALARLLHDVDLTISLIIGVYVLLGGPLPFVHMSPHGAILLVIKYVALLMLVVLIKNIMGRYRIEQALIQLFKYSLLPATLAAVLAMITG